MKNDLGITLSGDFKIILAAAEKMQPGLYSFVCSDAKQDFDRIQSIFDAF